MITRECPSGVALYEVEIPVRTFRPAVLTNDGLMMVMLGHEKNRDYLYVFQSQTGVLIHKFIPRYQGAKKDQAGQLVPVPGKATQIALMDQDKGTCFSNEIIVLLNSGNIIFRKVLYSTFERKSTSVPSADGVAK